MIKYSNDNEEVEENGKIKVRKKPLYDDLVKEAEADVEVEFDAKDRK